MCKHHFDSSGKEPVTPMMETQVTFSLGLYMGETQVWFYIYESNVEKYFNHENKSRLVYRPTYEDMEMTVDCISGTNGNQA